MTSIYVNQHSTSLCHWVKISSMFTIYTLRIKKHKKNNIERAKCDRSLGQPHHTT